MCVNGAITHEAPAPLTRSSGGTNEISPAS